MKRDKLHFLAISFICLIIIFYISACKNIPNGKPVKNQDASSRDLTHWDIENAEYSFLFDGDGMLGETVKLKNGNCFFNYSEDSVGHEEVQTELIALGDLNNDGKKDAAVIFWWNGGGSGTFYHLAAFVNENGKPKQVDCVYLGYRVEPYILNIKSGSIILDIYISMDENGNEINGFKEIVYKPNNNKLERISFKDSTNYSNLLLVTAKKVKPGCYEYKGNMEYFIKKGADVNIQNDSGETALMFASQNNNEEMVKILLKAGANVNAQDRIGETALFNTAINGNNEIAKTLIDANANVDIGNIENETPLMMAAEANDLEMVKVLLDAKANVNAQQAKYGFTALIFAAGSGNIDIVKTLLEAGADVNLREHRQMWGGDNNTALDCAKEAGQEDIVNLLKQHEAKE